MAPRRPARKPIRPDPLRSSCLSRPAVRLMAWRVSFPNGWAPCLANPIVIENRGGAGGGIGGKFVAEADSDGYTVPMTPGGALTTGPAVNPNIGYDPAKVFASIGELIETPTIISVSPSLPATSMAEVVSYAKANPGKLKWGSQGFGTAPHLLAEMFKLEAGINIVHVPYRGTGPLLNAILA